MARSFAGAVACALATVAANTAQAQDPAATLRTRYAALQEQLEHSPLQQGLHVESVEGPGILEGNVYAVVDYPIGTVSDALASPTDWCDTLILHLNVKYCHPVASEGRTVLAVAIGRKEDQPLTSSYRVDFVYSIVALQGDYLQVALNASKGPLGTRNYRFDLEAVSLEDGRSFVHLRYSYQYGFWARVAMRFYLRGAGSDKVGFTITGRSTDEQPTYIGGVRGIVERNIMRYYLAIDAHLGTTATPVAERFEQSLERWFDATERYSRQLHEVDRDTYVAMKRSEYLRQQTVQ
jgi:hypothetical protein